MAIFRCKMCGGDLEVTEGSSSCTCEFCGTKQTLPTITDEALQSLFNRANVLRMKSEFDKAADVYEKILQRSEQEAEAYWGLILCKYGIEYVEDPATFKRVPTCHRASYDAVTADEDYKNALHYADPARRSLYEAEAAAIDEIQRGIIALAQKEDPYDVFICYKETDESGKRTQDSVIANDIYHQLTLEGFKVFYAAITLEDKLGKEYEPYIFSALNTAKVMLALGTKPEYFSAVWVRNEWSRFLKIMKKDRSKLLIPCYRDMDPYELPEEFAHLQAQDMSKIGFISDLTRGIRKVLVKEPEQPKVQETVVVPQQTAPVSGTTAAAQIKRGNMALEDHEWEKADDFFEEALNLDPECAEAYLGKLLARDRKPGIASWVAMQKEKYSSASTEQLEACPEDTDHINRMCSQYALEEYLSAETIRDLYSYDRTYPSVLSCRRSQKTKQLSELKSDRLFARAQQYAKGETTKQLSDSIADITAILDQRIAKAEEDDKASVAGVKVAYTAHLKQSDEKATSLCRDAVKRREKDNRIEEANRNEAARKARKKIVTAILGILLIVLVGTGYWAYQNVVVPNQNYAMAMVLLNNGKYEDAIAAFENMNGYKDSSEKAKECRSLLREDIYQYAVDQMNEEKYEAAIVSFKELNDYKDSMNLIYQCELAINRKAYAVACSLEEKEDYPKAAFSFGALGNYMDSQKRCFALWKQFTLPDTLDQISSGIMRSIGIKDDRTVVEIGSSGTRFIDWTDVISVSAAIQHSVGLKSDGTVLATGKNEDGRCDVNDWTDIIAISAGSDFTVGLKADGTVLACGNNTYGQCNVEDWNGIIAISAGGAHTIGLKSDGTVLATGLEDWFRGVEAWNNIVAVRTGSSHTVGIKSDKTVVAVGYNHDGQCDVNDWKDICLIRAAGDHTVGLREDGSVVAAGNNQYGQCDVETWTDIIAISTGDDHTIGFCADGTTQIVGSAGKNVGLFMDSSLLKDIEISF